jgi:hypothetical protein
VCSKRVEGASALQDETVVSIERNDEGRSKEGDAAGLNTSLPLGASEQEVTHLWQGLILAVLKL